MRSYSLIAPAKINLYLEILGDHLSGEIPQPDGFHEMVMVLQSVSLTDQIDLRASGTDAIRVHCTHPQVPNDASNLAYKAAALMVKRFPDCFARYGGVEITIHKQIPVGAGLAGGSSNAAAVLVGLDLLWELGLTRDELQELGAVLGSDVPFCIAGGTALATGRGEQLDVLPALPNLYVVLAKYRSLSVSTAWAYTTYRQTFGDSYVRRSDDLEERRQHVHASPMLTAIAQRDGTKIGQRLRNDLEKVVLPEHPQVLQLREAFQQAKPLGTMMSGSGPTVFALAESQTHAEQIQAQVKGAIANSDLEFWIAKFNPSGIQIVE
ncbi:4-(cytidine 5'-diphospho)-2-C-methyl-D-erythritol kinase [Stenomitos frigidus]|uniref:4-diphosphocytidyl-2-C-methyl-D-erythritol kinase n=1 Tax=Stenomitos frigidus ULC18 TaxID=2107698 RepID=A0A2T1DYX8_9CYAN|nr:4-(cytidine 5'-diphospho)-2-C-methyl-D-erythritol kinase [Stenomitos frigidus]PSB25682.1 4-(cytidine 5'-diphospho)-2-C-methyl-D-erythritol kinase [Stenomitos frigidus ULC18]